MEGPWNIGSLLSVSSRYWEGCTLQAAVRLEIFSAIGEKELSADEISGICRTDSHATKLFCNALAAMELLEKSGDIYKNTEFSASFLIKQSPQYIGHIILHHHHLLDGWAQLDRSVKTGSPVEKRSYGEEIERESFIMGMYNLAAGLAPEICRKLDIQGKRKLLDLGGGPGTYAIHFCKANPDLEAVIFDRETTRKFAQKTVSSFQLEERITFEAGDFNTSPITGGPYDVAWLSHILHSNSYEDCQELINKTVQQLEPGGIIFIHDFLLENSMDKPRFGALFSLNMLINNGVGRSYSLDEVRKMFQNAGVSKTEHITFESPNDSSILKGRV